MDLNMNTDINMNMANNSYGYPLALPSQVAASNASSAADGVQNSPSFPISESEKVSKSGECQTCKNRKYQDGSNEMVSFKTAQNVSPLAAPTMVRSHESEHVANAYSKAMQQDAKVLQASVRIKTSICPECGRAYVSGGETSTKIQYTNKNNPYTQNLKQSQSIATTGRNVDLAG